MGEEISLGFLILYGILAQGFGSLPEENIEESSLLDRVKRLIDKTPNGDRPVTIDAVPYIVNILKDGNRNCAGSILEPEIILTAAHCFDERADYSILSGSSSANRGMQHDIIETIIHPGYHRMAFPNDLALLKIYPPIALPNRKIFLHNEPVTLNSNATVSGWGCNCVTEDRMEFPHRLRSITIPIISQGLCRRAYHGHIEITNANICTLDSTGQKCCGTGDSGAPLVVHGQLIGVFAGSRGLGERIAPDIFMKLTHPIYRSWIISNISYFLQHPQFSHNSSQDYNHSYNPHHLH